MLETQPKNWFYEKMFYITNEQVFKDFKNLLEQKEVVKLETDYDKHDFRAFKFNKDKPLYRISTSKSYGCSTVAKYKTYSQYLNYPVVKVYYKNIHTHELDWESLSKLEYFDDNDINTYTSITHADIVNTPTYQTFPTYTIDPYKFSTCTPLYSGTVDPVDICTAAMNDWYRTLEVKHDNKKENDFMKLLEIYKEAKLKEYTNIFASKQEEIKLKDKTYATIAKLGSSAKYVGELPDEITDKLKEAERKYENEKTKLNNLVKEVEAQLEICETYEQKINILKLYNVLNEDGKLNI